MQRSTFLEILLRNDPEEINEFIRKKGKPHKMVNLISFVKDDDTYIDQDKTIVEWKNISYTLK